MNKKRVEQRCLVCGQRVAYVREREGTMHYVGLDAADLALVEDTLRRVYEERAHYER